MTDWVLDGWPMDENGEPEEEVLLCNENDIASESGVCTTFLESCGIPYLARRPSAGEIGFLYGGFSPAGINIYVPASMLEQARDLINGDEEYITYEDDEEDLLL